MAEVLVVFDATVSGPDGRDYTAQVCGAVADDGLWEGWLEFAPADGGARVRTPRETEQPNRDDLRYWAGGLTVAYLEGALARALDEPHAVPVSTATPFFDAPAPRPVATESHPGVQVRAVLDPFAVYAQGPDVLRRELHALSGDQLRNVVLAYQLDRAPATMRATTSDDALAEAVYEAVRRRMDAA